MNLSPNIAAEITHRARLVLNREIYISNSHGQLLGEPEPILAIDALRACQEGRVIRGELNGIAIAWCPFVYEQQTIGSFGVVESEVQTTPEALNLLQGLAEVIVHQHFLLEHAQPSEKMQADFLRQVLTSPAQVPDEVYRQADILQLNLRGHQAVILIDVADFEHVSPRPETGPSAHEAIGFSRAMAVLKRLDAAFRSNNNNVISYFGHGRFVILKGIGGDNLTTRNTSRFLREKAAYIAEVMNGLEELNGLIITIGVGQYYPDIGGLRKSFQEARLALAVGSKVWGPGKIYHIKDVGMFVTLANVAQEHKAELAHQILYPLLRDEQLYKTVRSFLQAGLNLTDAAAKLHIHRNTLIYRLDKTKKLIGLDPRIFDDALQIKLGLMFYQPA